MTADDVMNAMMDGIARARAQGYHYAAALHAMMDVVQRGRAITDGGGVVGPVADAWRERDQELQHDYAFAQSDHDARYGGADDDVWHSFKDLAHVSEQVIGLALQRAGGDAEQVDPFASRYGQLTDAERAGQIAVLRLRAVRDTELADYLEQRPTLDQMRRRALGLGPMDALPDAAHDDVPL